MRAKFINEKFQEKSDPIKDMKIGYNKRVLNSMSWKVLEFIKSKGEKGAGLTEIQYYIWTKLEGKDPKKFWEKSISRNDDNVKGLRKTRGHWNTNLLGGKYYHEGLLHKFCKKNPKTKKWVFVRFPKVGENLYNWYF